METRFEHPYDEVSSSNNHQWRRYGEARRKELIEKDEWTGGTSFRLNKKCRPEKYFELTERVITEFKYLCKNLETNAEDAYVMGHRLISFLSQALPKHPLYTTFAAASLRNKVQKELYWIREKMIEIALIIDEEQLNKYITNDFVPDPVEDDDEPDDSSLSSVEVEMGKTFHYNRSNEEEWERFEGWSFDLNGCKNVPCGTDTDSSSFTRDSSSDSETETDQEQQRQQLEFRAIHKSFCNEGGEVDTEIGAADPEPDFLDSFDEEDDEEYQPSAILYDIENSVLESEFLKRVANEDVRFETDSEALDSWAQNGSDTQSTSSCPAFTCDPARIAFQEIMNKLPRSPQRSDDSVESPPVPAAPTNSPVESPTFKLPHRHGDGNHNQSGFRFSSYGARRAN